MGSTASSDGSVQAGDEQGSQVVGTSPREGATRIMAGLEVEPMGAAGPEHDLLTAA